MRRSDDPIYARKRRVFIKRHDPKAWRFDQLPPEVQAQWNPDEMEEPIIERECRWCGEIFVVSENHQGNRWYCNRRCYLDMKAEDSHERRRAKRRNR